MKPSGHRKMCSLFSHAAFCHWALYRARASVGSRNKRANSGIVLQKPLSAELTPLDQKAHDLQIPSSWKVFWGAALHNNFGRESLPEASAVGHCFSQATGMDLM